MSTGEANKEPDGRAALRSAVEAELAREASSLRFPAILQARYEADSAVPRSRELRKLAAFGSVVYFVVVLLIHLLVMKRPNLLAFLTQLIVFPPVIFVVMRHYAKPEVSVFKREGAVLALCCMVVLGSMLDIATGPTDVVVMNMFLLVAPITGCMSFTRMSPISGVIFVAFTTANLMISVLARTDIPAEIRYYPLAGLLSAGFFALLALRELDGASRRVYLHGLAQALRIEDLAAENRSLDLLSETDALTGVGNRRQFESTLAGLRPSPTAGHFLLLIDIDYFKQVNDRFGHQTGDACLREAAVVMRRLLRPSDTIARVGGDEFAILLIDCSVLEARRTADRLCVGVADHRLKVEGRIHQLSVTIGGAEWNPDREVTQFFARADAALYRAKHAGRGRVAWAATDDSAPASPQPAPDGTAASAA